MDPCRGDIYYHFIEKYNNEDLYLTCLAMNILQDGEFHSIDDLRDKFFLPQETQCGFQNTSFNGNEFDFIFFIDKLIRNESNKNSYSLEDIQSFIKAEKTGCWKKK